MSLPADNQSKVTGPVWQRGSQRTVYVTCRSKVAWFMGHWSSKMRGSCRCLGELCPICLSGVEPRPFYYIAVTGEDDQVKYFEIPRRHRKIAEEMDASPSGGVGIQLAIRKEGKASNSPIDLIITGLEDCSEIDPWPFVNTLGRSLVPLAEPRSNVELAKQSESFQEASTRVGAM